MDFRCGRIETPEPRNCSDNISYEGLFESEKDESVFNKTVELYLIGIIAIFGLFGNILSVVVLRKDKERRESLFLLQALALADGLYLLAALVKYPLKHLIDQYIYEHIQMGAFPLLKTFQTICIWTMVLVTIDRYVYVCHPLRAQKVFSRSSRRIWAAGIFAAGFIYNVPRFVDSCISTFVLPCSGALIGGMMYRKPFNNVIYYTLYRKSLYLLLLYAIPLTLLACLNCRLVRAIRRSRRQHAYCAHTACPHDRTTHDNNATTFLVMIIIVFLACESIEPIIHILSLLEWQFGIKVMSVDYMSIYAVSALLMVINSSANFLIYVALGHRFRRILKETLQQKFMMTSSLQTRETVPLQRKMPPRDIDPRYDIQDADRVV